MRVCACVPLSPPQANVESFVFLLGLPSVLYVGYNFARTMEESLANNSSNAYTVPPPLALLCTPGSCCACVCICVDRWS